MSALLDRELQTFEAHREELVGQAKGKYVLIKEDRVVGLFETWQAGVDRGFQVLGHTPFLVKKVLTKQEELDSVGRIGC
jgi:hypothetical protein